MENLQCGLEEHIHTDACYAQSEDPDVVPELICGLEEHTHSAECQGLYNQTGQMKLEYYGSDYTVSVSCRISADQADSAVLSVRELPEAYSSYQEIYSAATEALLEESPLEAENELGIRAFRLFALNIHNEEETIIPETLSAVSITYTDETISGSVRSFVFDGGQLFLESPDSEQNISEGTFSLSPDGTLIAGTVIREISQLEEHLEKLEAFRLEAQEILRSDYSDDQKQALCQNLYDNMMEDLSLAYDQNESGSLTDEELERIEAAFGEILQEMEEGCGFRPYSLMTLSDGEYVLEAQTVSVDTMYNDRDDSEYLLLALEAGKYYALGGDGQTYELTENGSTLTYCSDAAANINKLCWKMSEKETDSNSQNSSHRRMVINNTQSGKYLYPNGTSLITDSKTTVNLWIQEANANAATIYPDDPYWPKIAFGDSHTFHTYNGEGENEAWFYFAKVTKRPCHVWLDGTDGSIMSLGGAGNEYQAVSAGESITLPSSFKSPDKYAYKLKGWYDVNQSQYYSPGKTVMINNDTVFYADWEPVTYDIGQKNEHTVSSLDTSAFITTHVFDYGALFNVMSSNANVTPDPAGHKEIWTITNNPSYGSSPLNLVFRDWDTFNESISYPVGAQSENDNSMAMPNAFNSDIYSGISNPSILNVLFHPTTGCIGKNYVGTGNYLYQYDADTGYYYYDSKKNAASYNRSDSRFYIYDYLERTSDSPKDSTSAETGRDSDFLPFNSPYVNTNGKTVQTYNADNGMTGYQYDAKYDSTEGGVTCSPGQAGTNYWFGMSSQIKFYLPDNSAPNGSGKKNQSTKGTDMKFSFSGDDDVWIFVDGDLVLDIGGLHGIEEGYINFSTGEVWRSLDNGDTEIQNFTAGEHILTIYYMERGASQSNCAIYFNIAPQKYSLELTKTDREDSNTKLPGAEFTFYSDEACTNPVNSLLKEDGTISSSGTFVTDGEGRLHCYGLMPETTYYIRETKAPAGYNGNENVVIKLSIAGIQNNYRVTSELYVDGQKVELENAGNIYLKEDKSELGTNRELNYTFSNQAGYVLPETGGIGTEWMEALGTILILCAAFLAFRKRI
ncbi:MAG: SpaA isopeptide-forming pilin-related protein [Anaerovoracaceae bacterium]